MTGVNQFVRERYLPYRAVGGQRVHFERADFRTLRSPFDHSPIASVGFMGEAEAFENLATIHRTFHERRQQPIVELIGILKRTAQRVRSRAEEYAELIAWEGGKPLKDARIEVARAAISIEWAAEEAGRIAGHEVPMRATAAAHGRLAFTFLEPIGPVLAISAFNHPLNLIAHQIAPALAVGCPVLVKPAPETPLSCLHLLEDLYESGLAPEMALPVVCDNDVAEKLVRSAKIAFLTFIGSAKIGWHLRQCLAPGVRFSLEHGGSAPVIVDESAELDRALPLLTRGAFYHSGQVCVSVQRLFVHERLMPEFEARFVEAAEKLVVGDPRVPETDCGPLIRARDLERVELLVQEATGGGARVLTGGRRQLETCFQPTVLRGLSPSDRVMREEVFGPVVCLEPFRDIEEAIANANAVDWAFQAAIFTQNLDRALLAARRLKASAVVVNDSTAFRVDWMPFRGNGPSGFGTGGIPYAMRDMVNEKLVVL